MIKAELRFAGQTVPGPTVRRATDQLAHGIATAMAEVIRERVSLHGDLAGQPTPPPASSAVSVSPSYPDAASGRLTQAGLERFETREAWRANAGVVRGSYRVSGGMWASLAAVKLSMRRSELQFLGASPGQNAPLVGGVPVPQDVPNSTKASTILERHGVNVLALSDRELAGIARGVATVLAQATGSQLPVRWSTPLPPAQDVARRLADAMRDRA